MSRISRFSDQPEKKLKPDEDLDDGRLYLESLGGAMIESARSADPRVVWLALAFARSQGASR